MTVCIHCTCMNVCMCVQMALYTETHTYTCAQVEMENCLCDIGMNGGLQGCVALQNTGGSELHPHCYVSILATLPLPSLCPSNDDFPHRTCSHTLLLHWYCVFGRDSYLLRPVRLQYDSDTVGIGNTLSSGMPRNCLGASRINPGDSLLPFCL